MQKISIKKYVVDIKVFRLGVGMNIVFFQQKNLPRRYFAAMSVQIMVRRPGTDNHKLQMVIMAMRHRDTVFIVMIQIA